MGQALYRQYRPKKLADVAGQEHITKTLNKALASGQISHAYLFTGPRGVGKTSVARILAHEVNRLAYSDDKAHIDIIEIDAASNRRIDEIRELRERVYLSPAEAAYKVYIIDEVHMLTKEAFNALLKTLEEPPAHVIFILATTDIQKLPETIISRTQRHNFKPISAANIAAHLEAISAKEKIKSNADALKLIAEHSDGSLRDALSLLDHARSYASDITLNSVNQLLGLPPSDSVDELLDLSLNSSEAGNLIGQLAALYEQGHQPAVIAKLMGGRLRQRIIDGQRTDKALTLLSDLIDVAASNEPTRYLEIVLLKAQPVSDNQASPAITNAREAKVNEVVEAPEEDILPSKLPKPKSSPKMQFNDDLWAEILLAVKQKHNTLYGVVRMAEPSFQKDGVLKLSFAFDFHKKKLSEAANQKLLADIINELTGQSVTLEYELDKAAKPAVHDTSADDDLAAISQVFSGAELLES